MKSYGKSSQRHFGAFSNTYLAVSSLRDFSNKKTVDAPSKIEISTVKQFSRPWNSIRTIQNSSQEINDKLGSTSLPPVSTRSDLT